MGNSDINNLQIVTVAGITVPGHVVIEGKSLGEAGAELCIAVKARQANRRAADDLRGAVDEVVGDTAAALVDQSNQRSEDSVNERRQDRPRRRRAAVASPTAAGSTSGK